MGMSLAHILGADLDISRQANLAGSDRVNFLRGRKDQLKIRKLDFNKTQDEVRLVPDRAHRTED